MGEGNVMNTCRKIPSCHKSSVPRVGAVARRFQPIFVVAIFAVLLPTANAAVDIPDAGEGAAYWWKNSLVFAKVISIAPGVSNRPGLPILVRPLGTLSGRFDSGTIRELRTFAIRVDFFDDDRKAGLPRVGDNLLLVIANDSASVGHYRPGHLAAYMPGQSNQPNRIISGFSDPEVALTLRTVQALRKHDDLPGYPTWRDLLRGYDEGLVGPEAVVR